MSQDKGSLAWANCRPKKRFGRATAERKAFWFGVTAYACDVCGAWHLTSKARR